MGSNPDRLTFPSLSFLSIGAASPDFSVTQTGNTNTIGLKIDSSAISE